MVVFPFTALVGQERLKQALILCAIDPEIGGLLIRGEKGTAKSTAARGLSALIPGMPFVNLPLNATEDMVLGSIDFEAAIKTGEKKLRPGLLAEAHNGILYIDEVNLLEDHLVDIILDASSNGINRVERDNISISHESRFILVGTMNPEEGDLRPQILDRFGLCVEIESEKDIEKRVDLIERREGFDTDPDGFLNAYRGLEIELQNRIQKARAQLSHVRFPEEMSSLVADFSLTHNVQGHRADLTIRRAACAFAAFRERELVTLDDVRTVAPMALIHRRREHAMPGMISHVLKDNGDDARDHDNENGERMDESLVMRTPIPGTAFEAGGDKRESEKTGKILQANFQETEMLFETGAPFSVIQLETQKDRIKRKSSGRRSRTRTSGKSGRYVKSVYGHKSGDLALDATLRAAVPYQNNRKHKQGIAINIAPWDIKEKVREKRVGNFFLFIVDSSGSIGAQARMIAVKGAVMSLLLDAYQKRDKVALVTFRERKAEILLEPTSSIELAGKLLKEIPTGGRTPLADGLLKGYAVVRRYLAKEPDARPIIILLTDGKGNVFLADSLGGGAEKYWRYRKANPHIEAVELADKLSQDERVKYIVIDSKTAGSSDSDRIGNLAAALNAEYFSIDDLKSESLLRIVRHTL